MPDNENEINDIPQNREDGLIAHINDGIVEQINPAPLTEGTLQEFMRDLEMPMPEPRWAGIQPRTTRRTAVRLATFPRFDEELTPFGTVIKKDMRKINKDGTVVLCENGKVVKEEEAVYVSRLDGWFLKDTPDLHQDILNPNVHFLLNKKYIQQFVGLLKIVYTDINEKGELINPKYTSTDLCQFVYASLYPFNRNIFNAPEYIDLRLLNNTTFKEYYKESLLNGQFYHLHIFDPKYSQKHPKYQYRKCKSRFKTEVDDIKPTTYIKTLGKQYSFGLEIETSSGYLPPYLDTIIDYSAVHDGSLKDPDGHTYGGEYVTGVLKGDKGLLQTKMLCNEVSKRCLINHLCGVHTHIGGVNFTKENIVLMYYLYSKLEKEIFSMLPKSRRDNEYCRKLPKLSIDLKEMTSVSQYMFLTDYYYNQIIAILSQKDGFSEHVNKKRDHPRGHKCSYDHSTARYCWVNFIPAVFDTRGNGISTIEFRPHSATTSYYKIKNWLLICMALVDVIENHKNVIYTDPNISLSKVIELSYPKDNKKLLDYIEKRINKFSSKDNEESDYTDNEVDENVTIKNI